MAKYHIKADGSPGKCNAQKGNCPFGENAPHFESIEDAQQFADLKNRIEVEDDFRLSWNKIYLLNEQEADSLVNSIDKVVGGIDNEIQAIESEMRKLTMTEEWFNYKDSEEDFKEAKSERIRISNSDDDHAESMALMREDLGRITGVHEFRDGDYLIEISSKDYWPEKPKYTGYKINEDGTKEQIVLPKMPQEVVQKAFKSKENKDAFAETKKAKNAFIMYRSNTDKLKRNYPPVEYNNKLEAAKAKEEKALQEFNEKKDSEVVKEVDRLNDIRWNKLKSRKKNLEEQKRDILRAQDRIKEFHQLGGHHKKGDYGQFSDDNDEILVRAREHGIEQPVRHIQHKHFVALMADSLSTTKREQRELEERYDKILRKYGLSYWNGKLRLID